MDYPKADRTLSHDERKELVERLTIATTELQSLADDPDFKYQSLTGSVARLVQDWCVLVEANLRELDAEQTRPAPNDR